MSLITVNNLVRYYGDHRAVDDISFNVGKVSAENATLKPLIKRKKKLGEREEEG